MPNPAGSHRLRMITTGCLILIGTATLFQNCAKAGSDDASSTSTSGNSPGGLVTQSSGKLVINPISAKVTNLGTQLVVPVTLAANANYNGTVKFSVDQTELNILDTGGAITFIFSPASVMLKAGTSATTQMTVNISSMAPSFSASQFHVVATDTLDHTLTASVAVPLQVKAVFDINILGRANPNNSSPEKWTVDIAQVVGFISHAEGLTVNFNNLDTNGTHLIHSSGGPIPHQSTTAKYPGTSVIGLPASKDGVIPGGVYGNVVAAGTTKSTSQVYCHDDEGGSQARTLNFNLPQPVTVTTVTGPVVIPTTNPNATFTYLNNNIFKTSCVSCHSTANAQGGVDLSSYASVLKVTATDDAADSAIYLAVTSSTPNVAPTMPKGKTALTTALTKDISDWINSGAPNN